MTTVKRRYFVGIRRKNEVTYRVFFCSVMLNLGSTNYNFKLALSFLDYRRYM